VTVTAVVFDVDGTLVDHDRAQHDGLTAHLADLGQALDDVTWRRWRKLEEHHFARYLAGELSFEDQRRARVRGFTGDPLDDDRADGWFDAYRVRFEESWRLFDDVLGTLARLDGLTLAAFSNVSGAYTRHKLDRVGLLDRFVLSWGVDDVGAAKPDPRTYTAVLAELGVPHASAVHVGDRYESDARGACAAGVQGVWLDRPGADPAGRVPTTDPDPRVAVVTSLLQVVDLAEGGQSGSPAVGPDRAAGSAR
jgi:putative hydrolase of the HAD superfamily